MARKAQQRGPAIDRRTLMIGGGAGIGLLLAWSVWPRRYPDAMAAAENEVQLAGWVKVGRDHQVTIGMPQGEFGQGIWTGLSMVLADEIGADWRYVGVEPVADGPKSANAMAADAVFGDGLAGVPGAVRDEWLRRIGLTLTAGSTSVRRFEAEFRAAGAAARCLLQMAAADRWGVDWRQCTAIGGTVRHGDKTLRFGEIAEAAAGFDPPDPAPLRDDTDGRLIGQPLPRLEMPAKMDGSANFAGDIRLPGMVHASVRGGPVGDTELIGARQKAARAMPGVIDLFTYADWVAVVGTSWWAAERALDVLAPRFRTDSGIVNSDSIDAALDAALEGSGERIVSRGDLSASFRGARIITGSYRAGLVVHTPLEPASATAAWQDGRLTLWIATQAPSLAREAAAAAIGIDPMAVILHPMQGGGGCGAKLETRVAAQAAILARRLEKPVQLTWSRAEQSVQDRFRPPAAARMAARLDANGSITGWAARIAAPSTGREMAGRLMRPYLARAAGSVMPTGIGDRAAVAGAETPYGIANLAVDHHPADIGVPTGYWRSGAHSYTAFFTECFVDELARLAQTEPLSYRIAMLGGSPRLARCLTTIASLGEWQGAEPGSGQGIAAHSFAGSHIAVLAEARMEGARVRVDRLVAAVDCGRVIHPDLVQQQIEGGMLAGMAAAIAGGTGFTENLADVRGFAQMRLPMLSECPDITVEILRSDAEPGGISELGVPAVAPAIANALATLGGDRLRTHPFRTADE
ncbi:xanthine dehydrogenase family protein molybdopterin-binding subunit [Sphingomonas sp. FW199]|uniref:xanthine dehydrogenase family protein molybdopterin-binding subunit n=1 Tax=Sphingomonas sp. FW199 TaxID=3400217 RepID=UPI003CF4C813